jgi:hypothetical protein
MHTHAMYESGNFDLSLSIPRHTPGQGGVGSSIQNGTDSPTSRPWWCGLGVWRTQALGQPLNILLVFLVLISP